MWNFTGIYRNKTLISHWKFTVETILSMVNLQAFTVICCYNKTVVTWYYHCYIMIKIKEIDNDRNGMTKEF